MEIIILNGSPKGTDSVTMQYVNYLAARYPQHRFRTLPVAQKSAHLAGDAAALDRVVEATRRANLVLWAFPVYILLVCSQYKRFIELLVESGETFPNCYAASLSTSIKYHDIWAHEYVQSIAEDLGMRVAGRFSAKMRDLAKQEERDRLESFAETLFADVSARHAVPRYSRPLPLRQSQAPACAPDRPDRTHRRNAADLAPASRIPVETEPANAAVAAGDLDHGRAIIVADELPVGSSIAAMVDRMRAALGEGVSVRTLAELRIAGGCLGCCRCGPENRCAYDGKDDFRAFYENELQTADIIVFAGELSARQLSWQWRRFFDRSFFNTHTPSLVSKQFLFLISGPLSHVPHLRTVYQGWVELQHSNLVAFVSDESSDVDAEMSSAAARAIRMMWTRYRPPLTFLGEGGMKVFRDDIYGGLKVVFQKDHRVYRKRGYYDFPHRNPLRRVVLAMVMAVMRIPRIRRRFAKMIKPHMTKNLRAIVEATPPKIAPEGRAT